MPVSKETKAVLNKLKVKSDKPSRITLSKYPTPPKDSNSVIDFLDWRSKLRRFYSVQKDVADHEKRSHERRLEIIKETRRYSFLHGFAVGAVFMGLLSIIIVAIVVNVIPVLPIQ